MLAPTVNILRHPAWGRAQETYGEDVFLLGRLGSAFVDGVQQYASACAKHYAANNIENGRETAVAMMSSEQTLREIYARHFEMIVEEGGVSSIMAAYNQVGVAGGSALHSTQSAHLLKDILRTDFGFKGYVLSDWWAMPNGNSVPYPANSTLQPTALQAVQAGMDMELPWRYNYSTLTNLVSGGQLTSADLATSTARILEQKMRFKVDKMSGAIGLRQPFTTYNSNSSIDKNDQTRPGHRDQPHRPRRKGGRGVDGAAEERHQHAADPGDGEEDRRRRREGELQPSEHRQPGRLQLGGERLDQLLSRLHHQRSYR